MRDPGCVFCTIVAGEAEAEVVLDEDALYKALVLNEWRLRSRRVSSLVILLAVVAVSWLMVLDPRSGSAMMVVGKQRLAYDSHALAFGTTLVASLVIGIGVRERKTEIAVLKVLGFRPRAVLSLILGEALLVGALSGFMATATAYSLVNALGGIPLPIGFFGKFFIPENGLWWGPAIGGVTSLIGAILPSFTAYRIRASQVFSRVT